MAKAEVHKHPPGHNLPARMPRRYGRPRRVSRPEDLPLDFEDKMEEWGRKGLALTEVRANLDISAKIWLMWIRGWPEFKEVVERFFDLAESFWLRLGRENMGNKYFNTNLYANQMALRFKYQKLMMYQLEATGASEDQAALERDEDNRLEDLFSGGDGNVKVTPARTMQDNDADDWVLDADFRTVPK